MNKKMMVDQQAEAFVPPNVQSEAVECPLGCAPSDETVIIGHDLLHGLPGNFKVVCCKACGLQRTSPRPTPDSIGFYYPDDYGPYKGTRVINNGAKERDIKSRLIEIAKIIFDTKAKALPAVQKGRLLEIGCASGSFLHHMAQHGWDVEGIELSPTAAQAARKLGYAVDIGALEKISKPTQSYNLIVGWMVLEHLHQPVESLRKLASWAKRDAMLAVSVPNVGSVESRLFGSNWYALQLPNHLFHYDTTSITKVMHAAGWEVTQIHHHRNVGNLIASTGYWLCDKGLPRLGKRFVQFPEAGGRMGALLLFPLAFLLAAFGQTGRMTVWARRAC